MKLNKIILAFMLTIGLAQAELTATLHATKGNKAQDVSKMMTKLGSIGFSTVAANTNIQNFYYQKFKEKNVEMISFFGMINKKDIRELILKNPDFGAYSPFNFLVYKTLDTKNDDNTWFGHLDASMMLDIIGEKDKDSRAKFTAMVSKLDKFANSQLKPTQSKKIERFKPLIANPLTKMVKKFKKPEDMETFIEDFITDHDMRFSKHKFIISGFIDLAFEYDDLDLDFEKYDAYWVSLLCHFEFSNSIFNRGKPEAGMFAPCSIYFYIPKGKNELHVGYSSVNNWISGIEFKDEKRIKYMKSIDAEVVEVFKEMGFELETK